jgi:hypothetical protein
MGGGISSCYGYSQSQMSRRELLRALYTKMQNGLNIDSARIIYRKIDKLLPSSYFDEHMDLLAVDRLRPLLGIERRCAELETAEQGAAANP